MYRLYTWSTPNGRKASILLEELGVSYETVATPLGAEGTQSDAYKQVNRFGKIPALVDLETGRTIVESGALMLYLAEKHGRFLGEGSARWDVMEWVMWQMGALGPILGQTHHFHFYNPGVAPYAEERFLGITQELYGVLEAHLSARDWLAGSDYSIADMICFPWIARHPRQGVALEDYPNLQRWYRAIAARPAVRRGYAVPTPDDIPGV